MGSDIELIKLIRERENEDAFDELYTRYKNLAFKCASQYVLPYVPDNGMIEDICVDAWYKVWKRIHTYKPEYSFSTWLYGIVRHTSIDYLRKASRKPINLVGLRINTEGSSEDQDGYVSTVDNDASRAPDAGQVLIARENAVCIINIMTTTLTQQKYDILKLKFLGWKSKDIAAKLKTTPGSVDTLLSQAKKQIEPKITKTLDYSSIIDALDECIEHLTELLLTDE